jgi:uncharacterized MnhB-related membrane protein
MNSEGEAVISQPIAVVLMVLILGACIYIWTRGQLRSRAAMLAIAGILAVLAYFAFWATPTIA